jgi:peptide subunit release factor 1 (eRF1)
MLDELLGRAGLKERIEELEDERDRLQEQLEAEQRRRSEATRERQNAEERVNRLEDRIAQLEGEIDRLDDDDRHLSFRRTADLSGMRLDAVLDRLDSVEAGAEGALSAMVADELPDAVREAFGERAALIERAAPCLVYTDDAGLVSAALRPPLAPDPFDRWGETFRIDREWFRPTGRFAFALVRADRFAIGEYRGDERLSVETFESDVHGEHSKGGFSQARFERRRDEQIDDHLDRCRAAIESREAERLYVVGDREAVDEFEAEADATATVDATGDPEDALSDAFDSFYTTRLYCI